MENQFIDQKMALESFTGTKNGVNITGLLLPSIISKIETPDQAGLAGLLEETVLNKLKTLHLVMVPMKLLAENVLVLLVLNQNTLIPNNT